MHRVKLDDRALHAVARACELADRAALLRHMHARKEEGFQFPDCFQPLGLEYAATWERLALAWARLAIRLSGDLPALAAVLGYKPVLYGSR